MTMIPLPPNLEAALRRRAEATGLSLEDYVLEQLDPDFEKDPDFTAGTDTPPDQNYRPLTEAENAAAIEILERPPRNPSPALRKLLRDPGAVAFYQRRDFEILDHPSTENTTTRMLLSYAQIAQTID